MVYKLEGINFGENDIINLNVTIEERVINEIKKAAHNRIDDIAYPEKAAVTDVLFELEEVLAEIGNSKDTLTIAYENCEYLSSYKEVTLNYEIAEGLFANSYECVVSI